MSRIDRLDRFGGLPNVTTQVQVFENRFNLGISARHKKVFGTVSVNYSDDAFWTDVLTSDVYGFTDAYTMINATLGVRWNERMTLSVKGTNLANDDIQQMLYELSQRVNHKP